MSDACLLFFFIKMWYYNFVCKKKIHYVSQLEKIYDSVHCRNECKYELREVKNMPWCPNCKTEYREGIEKCADCGSVLVSSLNEEERVEESCSLLFGDEKHVRMIEKHLREEGFSSAFAVRRKKFVKENMDTQQLNQYELFVSSTEREAAVKCAAEFMRNTNPQAEEAAKNPESPRVAMQRPAPAQEFKTAKEKKRELKSSGIMLLCFGFAGLIFMVLVILGIIPIRFAGFNAIIAYSVMGVFFGALFVSGIMSLVSAKRMGGVNEEEQKQLDELAAWCNENLTKEIIEDKIPGDVSEDEQIYFERFEYMQQSLHAAFPDLKEDFLEYYTEKKYNEYFE